MKIGIFVGHSLLKNGTYTSANGYIREYTYCKQQGQELKNWLVQEGHTVDLIICPERTFTSAKEEYNYKVEKANKGNYDLIVELHLNAFNGSAHGCEVLHYDNNKGLEYAKRISYKLGTQFNNRGAKRRTDLYILRDTYPTAVLVESFFCDNKGDYEIATRLGYKGVAKLIAEGILNKTITDEKEVHIEQKYAVLINSYTDIVKARSVSHMLKHDDNLYSEVIDYKDKYAVKIYPLSPLSKAQSVQKLVKEKYNAYSDIIKL